MILYTCTARHVMPPMLYWTGNQSKINGCNRSTRFLSTFTIFCPFLHSAQSTAGEKRLRDGLWEQLWQGVYACYLFVCSLTFGISLLLITVIWLSPPTSKGNGQLQNGDRNSRHASLSEEEENLAVLRRWGISRRSFICNQITRRMDCGRSYLCLWSSSFTFYLLARNHPLDLFSLCLQARYERAAGDRESLRGGAALRIASGY